MSDEKLNLSEHVEALFEGVEGVSDEQKTKMETVLEAAVTAIVAEEREKIQEQVDAKVQELVESKTDEMNEVISKYMDYAVTEWMEENKVAVESGLQVEMAKSFFEGIKQVFVEHNVDVPEGKEDLVASYEEKITALEGKLNESTAKVIELGDELDSRDQAAIVAECAEGLTDTQKEKFDQLVEGIEFKDSESFKAKVQTIRESYFKGEKALEEGVKTESKQLTEEADENPALKRLSAIRNPYKAG